MTLHASNARGQATKSFKIKIGEEIALIPPMGWNSWNCWHGSINQAKILGAARGMVKAGLDRHGWTYVNRLPAKVLCEAVRWLGELRA